MARTKDKPTRHATTTAAGAGRAEQPPVQLTDQERRRLIAENAYFRALSRGFEGGDPLSDWLAAEREINRLLPGPKQQKEEQAVYDKLRAMLRERLAAVRENVTADTVREALDKARANLRDAGGHTVDTIDKVAGTIEKDIAAVVYRMGPAWESLSAKTSGLFEVWKDRGGAFLGQASSALGAWLRQAGERLQHPVYRTGELADAGTFECRACGERVVLETVAHLPVCSRCRKTEFRRV
jgi:hypothetical protein